jgi:hypothetical protein
LQGGELARSTPPPSLNRYLPFVAEIERIRTPNPSVQVHRDVKIQWQQTRLACYPREEPDSGHLIDALYHPSAF